MLIMFGLEWFLLIGMIHLESYKETSYQLKLPRYILMNHNLKTVNSLANVNQQNIRWPWTYSSSSLIQQSSSLGPSLPTLPYSFLIARLNQLWLRRLFLFHARAKCASHLCCSGCSGGGEVCGRNRKCEARERRKCIELIRLVKDWSDGVARIALLVLRSHAALLIESCPNTACMFFWWSCLKVFIFLRCYSYKVANCIHTATAQQCIELIKKNYLRSMTTIDYSNVLRFNCKTAIGRNAICLPPSIGFGWDKQSSFDGSTWRLLSVAFFVQKAVINANTN